MHEVTLKSFEELERYLRDFATWRGDGHDYDVVGSFALFRAIL